MSERREAGLKLLVTFPLVWMFFGGIGVLALGEWSMFWWFGGGITVGLYAVSFSVVGVAWFLDWRDERRTA